MQNNVVAAFRARLRKRGYSDISIKSLPDNYYLVSFIEPVFHRHVVGVLYFFELYHCFR